MSFFKNDEGMLLEGPNAVYGPTFTLLREEHVTYTYPVDGWYWFETEDEARQHFGLPPVEQQ